MYLLPPNLIQLDNSKIFDIDEKVKQIYRLITFSRTHKADDLLDKFISCNNNLAQMLSIKNAQMEAQTKAEVTKYLENLESAIRFVIGEINRGENFKNMPQLFKLFRIISPDAHAKHPNKFRQTIVQIGAIVCPEPKELPTLMTELYRNKSFIDHPIIKAIYFHHELIRIHPFSDGNGRTTRIAKNWMLMYNLYPPIFIKNDIEKREYISTLSKSFSVLEKDPLNWYEATASFFDQELERILTNADLVLNDIRQTGDSKLSSVNFNRDKENNVP